MRVGFMRRTCGSSPTGMRRFTYLPSAVRLAEKDRVSFIGSSWSVCQRRPVSGSAVSKLETGTAPEKNYFGPFWPVFGLRGLIPRRGCGTHLDEVGAIRDGAAEEHALDSVSLHPGYGAGSCGDHRARSPDAAQRNPGSLAGPLVVAVSPWRNIALADESQPGHPGNRGKLRPAGSPYTGWPLPTDARPPLSSGRSAPALPRRARSGGC